VNAQSEKYWPDEFMARARPIELLTENGFAIVRQWEWDGVPAPSTKPFHFLVSTPQGLEREIVVDVADSLIVETQIRTGGRVGATSSFWICCAERQLANHIAEHDECPPDNKLRIDECDSEEIMMAMRWTSA
jgi:hypothetical protein